jgi:cyclomaltodextrinase / maltogenic alpha-amylase / neopullulanase
MPVDTPAWARDAVFYQVFPDRFAASEGVPKPGPLEPWDAPPTDTGFKGGDLIGIVEHLPYLEDLGVDALYLNPVFSSASNHRYHTYDYFAVDPLLGGDDALRELLDAAHGRGMRVILDGVFNHTGRGFWPFHHVLETGASSPYRGWFHFDQGALDAGRPILAYPPFGTPAHEIGYAAWWGIPALPQLNAADPAVREYLMTVAEHWLRFGIDGWRLDVPDEIREPGFWQEFRSRCRAIRPDAYLVGEIWRVAPEWLGGDRFDALMDYPLAEAILGFAGGAHLDLGVIGAHREYGANVRAIDGPAFAARLGELLAAYDPDVVAVQLNLLGSHDTPRMRSILGGDPDAVRLATLLQLTLPGAPCLYYGDEVGLTGGNDPGCRGAFPWDESRWDGAFRAFVRELVHLRRSRPALHAGGTTIVAAAGGAVAVERRLDDARLVIAVNASDEPARLDFRLDGVGEGARLEHVAPGPATGTDRWSAEPDGVSAIALGPRSGSVLRLA